MPPHAKALLLDMDGVLAEVKLSYRQCIIDTVKTHGADIDSAGVTAYKLKGNANNDWVLSQRILADRGIEVSLEEVTATFEALYTELCKLETLIPAVGVVAELHRRCGGRVAVVTGRPRRDCDVFLTRFDLAKYVSCSVCMEDGVPKPAPDIVLAACAQLKVDPADAIMVGDTVDDVIAAVAAGSRAVGTLLPDDHAHTVLNNTPASSVPSAATMTEKGAEAIIRPGLADLLDFFPM